MAQFDVMSPEEIAAYKELNAWIDANNGEIFLDSHLSLIEQGRMVDAQNLRTEIETLGRPQKDNEFAEQYLELFQKTGAVPEMVLKPEEMEEVRTEHLGFLEVATTPVSPVEIDPKTGKKTVKKQLDVATLEEETKKFFDTLYNKAKKQTELEFIEQNLDVKDLGMFNTRLNQRMDLYLVYPLTSSLAEAELAPMMKPIDIPVETQDQIKEIKSRYIQGPKLQSEIQAAADIRKSFKEYAEEKGLTFFDPERAVIADIPIERITTISETGERIPIAAPGYTHSQFILEFRNIRNEFDKQAQELAESESLRPDAARMKLRQEIIAGQKWNTRVGQSLLNNADYWEDESTLVMVLSEITSSIPDAEGRKNAVASLHKLQEEVRQTKPTLRYYRDNLSPVMAWMTDNQIDPRKLAEQIALGEENEDPGLLSIQDNLSALAIKDYDSFLNAARIMTEYDQQIKYKDGLRLATMSEPELWSEGTLEVGTYEVGQSLLPSVFSTEMGINRAVNNIIEVSKRDAATDRSIALFEDGQHGIEGLILESKVPYDPSDYIEGQMTSLVGPVRQVAIKDLTTIEDAIAGEEVPYRKSDIKPPEYSPFQTALGDSWKEGLQNEMYGRQLGFFVDYELSKKFGMSEKNTRVSAANLMRAEIDKTYDIITDIPGYDFAKGLADRFYGTEEKEVKDPTVIASQQMKNTAHIKGIQIQTKLDKALEENDETLAEELRKELEEHQKLQNSRDLILSTVKEENSTLSALLYDLAPDAGILESLAASKDIGDHFTNAVNLVNDEFDDVLAEIQAAQTEGDIKSLERLSQLEYYGEFPQLSIDTKYTKSDDIVKNIVLHRLKKGIIYSDLGPGEAAENIIKIYLDNNASMDQLQQELIKGSNLTTDVENIMLDEGALSAKAFANIIDDDITTIYDFTAYPFLMETRLGDVPQPLRTFFPGNDNDTIGKLVENGDLTEEDFLGLKNEAYRISAALSHQTFMQNFGELVKDTTMSYVMDAQTGEVMLKPTAVTMMLTVLPALFEEAVAEIPYTGVSSLTGFLSDVDRKMGGVNPLVPESMADAYGGGRQSLDEYWEYRREELQMKQGIGMPYPLSFMFDNPEFKRGLVEYIDSKKDPGVDTIYFSDLEQYTNEYIDQLVANGELRADGIEFLRSDGALGDVESIYGKALGTVLTGRMDQMPFMLGTPAELDFYFQENHPDLYVGTRNRELNIYERWKVNVETMPPGFFDGYSWLASGFGFNHGSVLQSWQNTGMYMSFAIPFEDFGLGAASKAVKTAAAPVKSISKNLDAIKAAPTKTEMATRAAQFGLAGVEKEVPVVGMMRTSAQTLLKNNGDAPQGSGKFLQNEQLVTDIESIIYPTEEAGITPLLEAGVEELKTKEGQIRTLRKGIGHLAATGTSYALGYMIGGHEGGALAMVFQNPTTRQAGTTAVFATLGLTKPTRQLGVIPYYYRMESSAFEQMYGQYYKMLDSDMMDGSNNPLLDMIRDAKKKGEFYERDVLEAILARQGISMQEAVLTTADLSLKNLRTQAEIQEQLLTNRRLIDDVYGARMEAYGKRDPDAERAEILLDSMTGREILVTRSQGYKTYKRNIDLMISRNLMNADEAEVMMAYHRVLAIVSDNPDTYFDSIDSSVEKHVNTLDELSNQYGVDAIPKNDAYKLMKQTTWEEDAYYKSIGLYDYILKQDETVTVEDIRNYVSRFEKNEFLDDLEVGDLGGIDVDLLPPSVDMEGYSLAKVSIRGVDLFVYYKEERNRIILGEIHHNKSFMEMDKEIEIRSEATKVIMSNKLMDRYYNFEWNPEHVFYQVSKKLNEEEIISAQNSYSREINGYLDSFLDIKADDAGSYDPVIARINKKENPLVTKRNVAGGKLITKSLANYKGISDRGRLSGRIIKNKKTQDETFSFHPDLKLSKGRKGIGKYVSDATKNLEHNKKNLKNVNQYYNYDRISSDIEGVTTNSELETFLKKYILIYATPYLTKKNFKLNKKIKTLIKEKGMDEAKKEILSKTSKKITSKRNMLVRNISKAKKAMGDIKNAYGDEVETPPLPIDEASKEEGIVALKGLGTRSKETHFRQRKAEGTECGRLNEEQVELVKDEEIEKGNVQVTCKHCLKLYYKTWDQEITARAEGLEPGVLGESVIYQGLSRAEKIVERGNASVQVRNMMVKNSNVLLVETIFRKDMEKPRNVVSKSFLEFQQSEFAQKRKANDKDIAKYKRELKEYEEGPKEYFVGDVRKEVPKPEKPTTISPAAVRQEIYEKGREVISRNRNDNLEAAKEVESDARQIIREYLVSDKAPDFIGYPADNIVYGSILRSELKMAGVEITEKTLKDSYGQSYNVLEISDADKEAITSSSISVADHYVNFVGIDMRGIYSDLQMLPGDSIPALGSVGSMVLEDGSKLDMNSLDTVRKWMGIPDETDKAVVMERIRQHAENFSAVEESRYAGYTYKELEELADDETIPQAQRDDLKKFIRYRSTTQEFRILREDGKENDFVAEEKGNTLEIKLFSRKEELFPLNLLSDQVNNLIYLASQRGFDEVVFRKPNKATVQSLDDLAKSWRTEFEESADFVKITINEDMKNSLASRDKIILESKHTDEPSKSEIVIERSGDVSITVGSNMSRRTFLEQNALLLERLMDPEQHEKLFDYFEYEVIDGKKYLTRKGRRDMAESYANYQNAMQSTPDNVFRLMMDAVRNSYEQLSYYVVKGRAESGKVMEKPSETLNMILRNFNPENVMEETQKFVGREKIIQNRMEAARQMEGPIIKGIEGIQEAANREGRSFKKSYENVVKNLRFTVRIEGDEALDTYYNTERRAQDKLRRRAEEFQTPDDELVFELRPSRAPSIHDETKLIPERRRAKKDMARRMLEEEGIEAASITDDMIASKVAENELEGIKPKHSDIDRAYLDLVEERGNVDRQDLVLRTMSYVRMRSMMKRFGNDYTAMTSRTIISNKDRELYAQIAQKRMVRMFGMSIEDLVAKFDNTDDMQIGKKVKVTVEGKEEVITERPVSRPELKAVFKNSGDDAKVISNLRGLVNMVRGTPGMHALPEDLRTRIIKSAQSGEDLDFYLGDISYVRDAIIDMAAPLGARRNKTIESANRALPYNMLKGLNDLITDAGRRKGVISSTVQKTFDLIDSATNLALERYTPSLVRGTPWNPKFTPEHVARIQEILDQFKQSLQATPREIKRLYMGLVEKSSIEDVQKANKILFGIESSHAKSNLSPSMLNVIRLLRRFLHEPVSVSQIPMLKGMIARFSNRSDTTQISTLELESKTSRDRARAMKSALDQKYGDTAQAEKYNRHYSVFQKYLTNSKSPDIPPELAENVYLAVDEFNRIYINEFSSPQIMNMDEYYKMHDNLQTLFVYKGLSTRETDAFAALSELESIVKSGVELTEENISTFNKNIGVIIDGIEERNFEVRKKGETILRSVSGSRFDADFGTDVDALYTAYTLFYTGKITAGDMDFKKINETKLFDLNKPPNGVEWRIDDLIDIAKQFGAAPRSKNKQSIVGAIENRFLRDDQKLKDLSPDEIVNLANRIVREPTGTNFRSLLQMGSDKFGNMLEIDDKSRVSDVMIEMIIRLVIEEKLATLCRNISEVHVYGDLRQVTRERLIEVGLDPITDQEILLERIERRLDNWVKDGDYDSYYSDTSSFVPRDSLDFHVLEISNQIINTYGLAPASGKNVEKYVATDGKTYLLPNGLLEQFEELTQDVTAPGKARDKGFISYDDIREKKQNHKRATRALVLAERAHAYLVSYLKKNKDISDEDASVLVEQFLRESDPEFQPETARVIEERGLPVEPGEVEAAMTEFQEMELRKNIGETYYPFSPEVRRVKLDSETKTILDARLEIAEALHSKKSLEARIADYEEKLKKYKEEGGLKEPEEPRIGLETFETTVGGVEEPVTATRIIDKQSLLQNFKEYISLTLRSSFSDKRPVDAIRGYNLLKKQSVTTGFIIPHFAYYINNMLGALAQAYIKGGITGISEIGQSIASNPGIYAQGIGLLHGGMGGLSSQRYGTSRRSTAIMTTRDGRMYTAESLADAATRHGIGATFIKAEVGRSIGEDVRRSEMAKKVTLDKMASAGLVAGGAGVLLGPLAPVAVPAGLVLGYHASALNDLFMEMAQTTDNFFRFAMFMDQLHKGFSEAEAAKHVRNTFYDYSDLSPTEKNLLREIFLFYSYMRKNQVQVFNALVDNPSRVLGQFRMIANSQEQALGDEDPRLVLPDWLKTRYITLDEEDPFRTVRDRYAYKNKYGRKIRYTPMIGAAEVVPIIGNMLMLFQDDVTAYDTGVETWEFVGGLLGPQARAAYELTSEKFIFQGRELNRIRIDAVTVESVNKLSDLLGVRVFGTADNPGGFVELEIVPQDFKDITKQERTFYTVATPLGQLMLYLLLDLTQTLPGISLIEGRGRKMYRDFAYPLAKETILGEPIVLPVGFDLGDLYSGAFSFPSALMQTETEGRRRAIRAEQRKLQEQK
jgi:hypothetical protein